LAIGKLIRLLNLGGRSGILHLLVKVEGHVTKFFFDVADDFSFGGGGERIATLCHDLEVGEEGGGGRRGEEEGGRRKKGHSPSPGQSREPRKVLMAKKVK
jgi:hypothetical protein